MANFSDWIIVLALFAHSDFFVCITFEKLYLPLFTFWANRSIISFKRGEERVERKKHLLHFELARFDSLTVWERNFIFLDAFKCNDDLYWKFVQLFLLFHFKRKEKGVWWGVNVNENKRMLTTEREEREILLSFC